MYSQEFLVQLLLLSFNVSIVPMTNLIKAYP
jgi:hypothetical protein